MIRYKLIPDGPIKVKPLTEPLVFRVLEHTSSEVRCERRKIILHSVLMDTVDLENPNTDKIAIQIDAEVGDAIYRNLIYYQEQYWVTILHIKEPCFMPLKDYIDLIHDMQENVRGSQPLTADGTNASRHHKIQVEEVYIAYDHKLRHRLRNIDGEMVNVGKMTPGMTI